MPHPIPPRRIGILTAGGDCPGLNAAIRGVAKTAIGTYGMEVVGILDGFTGLVCNRTTELGDRELTGLLTLGGTILGTSRHKPHKMPDAQGVKADRTAEAVETYRQLGLDALVCIGGNGTVKNAWRLQQAGLNVITLPKTIDNDISETDVTFGFDSAMAIATEAIDRLHTTASSHQRIMLVDIMGHNTGWLTLGSSLAGGADVCLIPEIPYRFSRIVAALQDRRARKRRFSLVSVAEGAHPAAAHNGDAATNSAELAARLEEAVGMETRVTTLGYVQRGGVPTPTTVCWRRSWARPPPNSSPKDASASWSPCAAASLSRSPSNAPCPRRSSRPITP